MQMFEKSKEIFSGYVGYFSNDDAVESKAMDRAKICAGCELSVKSKIATIFNDDIKEVEGYICGECKCPLSLKIRSNGHCPEGLW